MEIGNLEFSCSSNTGYQINQKFPEFQLFLIDGVKSPGKMTMLLKLFEGNMPYKNIVLYQYYLLKIFGNVE